MNFEYSEEQRILKDSMQKWFQDHYSFDQRRVIVESDVGHSDEHWQTFAELGWLSVPFAEEYGGFGGNVIDIAAMMEEFGKVLCTAPTISSLILFGKLIEASGSQTLAGEIIPLIIDGSVYGALAHYEADSRYDLHHCQTHAEKQGDDYVINGSKALVIGGAQASKLIVSARTQGNTRDAEGLSLFLLDADTKGVSVSAYTTMDGHRLADIELSAVRLPETTMLGVANKGQDLLKKVMQLAGVAMSAEALGIMHSLNRSTVEYCKTRKQFGVSIASFQALQHRMVDCFMAYELSKSLLIGTLCELSDDKSNADEDAKAVAALRTLIARKGKLIGDEAIQMHGGMGLTDELHIGHYVKRLMMINLLFGNGDHYQAEFNHYAYAS